MSFINPGNALSPSWMQGSVSSSAINIPRTWRRQQLSGLAGGVAINSTCPQHLLMALKYCRYKRILGTGLDLCNVYCVGTVTCCGMSVDTMEDTSVFGSASEAAGTKMPVVLMCLCCLVYFQALLFTVLSLALLSLCITFWTIVFTILVKLTVSLAIL